MSRWSFLTNHARALLFIAQDPGVRLRDLAGALDVTERTAYGIVVDLTEAGYLLKEKEGRRNRYEIQTHLPLGDSIVPERTIGEVLALLADFRQGSEAAGPAQPHRRRRTDRSSSPG
jgi:DNA-binding IclR family transcriptional regulator